MMNGFDLPDLLFVETIAEAHKTEEAEHAVPEVLDDVDGRFGVSEPLDEDLKHPGSCGGERFHPGGMENLRGEVTPEDAPLFAVAAGVDVVLVAGDDLSGGERLRPVGENGAVFDQSFVRHRAAEDEDRRP